MKDNQLDRRSLKTRQAIQEALYSLMQEKQYNKIVIQEIIDRANVGRSTFYSHFNTKDELLISSIEHLMESMNEYVISYIEHNGDSSKLIPVTELFEHIKENSRIMKGLMKAQSVELFFDKAKAYWNIKIEQSLIKRMPQDKSPKVPINILVNHITSTFINLLIWWLDNKMLYSPAQMEQYFQELINPSIKSILGF
jgi:AcrR family transcriptional regulator